MGVPVSRSDYAARAIAVMIGVALGALILCQSTALGQSSGRGGGRHGGGGKAREPSRSDPDRDSTPPPTPVALTPHGGQYVVTESNRYEVVYMPLQTRIYVYDKDVNPVSARDLHAVMSLQAPMEDAVRRIPLQYVALPQGVAGQDYVAAVFDLRQLPDRDTPITFEFSGLPDRGHPTASFTPVFSPSQIRPYVAQVLPTEADRRGITRQQVCPVSGDVLGSQGPVIKVLIGEFPLYLSSKGCIEAVRQSPDRYLR
jgi:hypothetical protein